MIKDQLMKKLRTIVCNYRKNRSQGRSYDRHYYNRIPLAFGLVNFN